VRVGTAKAAGTFHPAGFPGGFPVGRSFHIANRFTGS